MTTSDALARLLVGDLIRHGVRDVVLCPGSRSAPLAYVALDAERAGLLRLHIRHDERVAAFTALGMGTSGSPAAVITTSGTAVANLHPAVVEARHAALPLVLVTADRPAESRGTWSNQTLPDQAGLFGPAHVNLDLPESVDDARTILAQGFSQWLQRRPGVLHINVGFREPLVPDAPATGFPPSAVPPGHATDGLPELELAADDGTLVIAGANHLPAGDPASGHAARVLAAAAGWPLLAEPSSGARTGDRALGTYRLLLDHARLLDGVRRLVVFGRPTLSRPVTALLNRPDLELVLVSPWRDWPEPGRPVTRVSAARAAAASSGGRNRLWQAADAVAQRAVDAVLDREERLSGLLVAREVATAMRAGESLFAAASNPIRDLDLAGGALADGVVVLANRGLSGIDGTHSAAIGHAIATGRPTRALLGDLAFLHDTGALAMPPAERRPAVHTVVVNDDGGGIFSLLEYGDRAAGGARDERDFERVFGTPHGIDLAALCAAHGVEHQRVSTRDDLKFVLGQPIAPAVTEVGVDRSRLRPLHAAIRARVAAELAALPG